MEITEFEKKRAANLIWNGAQDYSIDTGFRVYDIDGRADVYWNSIIGAVHLHYDWDKLLSFYYTFHETVNQAVYESLFWLALENATYEKEKDERPVFPHLRREYAQKKVDEMHGEFSLEDSAGQRLLAVTMGHFRHALGEDSGLPDEVDRRLLSEIEIGKDLSTDEIIAHLSRTLSTFFTYLPQSKTGRKKENQKHYLPNLFSLRRKKADPEAAMGPLRKMSFGYGEHMAEYGSQVLDQSHLKVAFANYTAQTDEGLKQYIEGCFGKPSVDEQDIKKLQKEYCTGNHTDVKLFLTKGDLDETNVPSGYVDKIRKEAKHQRWQNEKAYHDKEAVCRVQIERLTSRIRNSILTHLEEQKVYSGQGKLCAGRVYRALYLNDDRVFWRTIPGEEGNITVDLLLDASTSQIHRQEAVSAQGYMIAESLSRCGIPVRITSYCSLNGYLILTQYRDYEEKDANRNIFHYVSQGANRDGLAVRLLTGFLKDNHADHRILILLSDCQPNDVIKVRTSSGQYRDYAAKTGIEDTAQEVHFSRMQGNTVLCVYTGDEKNLPQVQRIYGRDFVSISSLDHFADAVGRLLQERIRMV